MHSLASSVASLLSFSRPSQGLRKRAVLGLSLAALAIACSAPSADSDDAVQGSEGNLTRVARKGDEFVRCWTVSDGNVDEHFRIYELRCKASSAGLKGLEASSVIVEARTASGSVQSGRPGETRDQELVIRRFYKSDFPLNVLVHGYWGSSQERPITYYRTEVPVAESATATAPVVLKVPFDSWPVTFINKSSVAVVSAVPYEVDAAPFLTEPDSRATTTKFKTTYSSGVLRESQASVELVAPKTGAIDVRVQSGRGTFDAKIPSPGVYVIEESSLRLATAEEEAAVAPPPSGGPSPSPDAEPAPAPDAGPPPAPAPTCGDPGQTYCKNASGAWSCNAGTRLDSNTSTCVACGDDGETYCFVDERNVSGAWKCNAGTRLDSSTGKCVACGDDGETYCFVDERNISGSWKCNAGTRLDSSTGKCVTCGALGQTHCVADPRNISGTWVCNAGLRVDSSSGNCVN